MIIKLPSGHDVLIDKEDKKSISEYKWFLFKDKHRNFYVRGYKTGVTKPKRIFMHRLILNVKNGEFTDHINHDGLDNRKVNIRKCTSLQNQMNRRGNPNRLSKFKGVTKMPDRYKNKPWLAQIRCRGKNYNLGMYATQEKAAVVYNKKASELFGEYAFLNVINFGTSQVTDKHGGFETRHVSFGIGDNKLPSTAFPTSVMAHLTVPAIASNDNGCFGWIGK